MRQGKESLLPTSIPELPLNVYKVCEKRLFYLTSLQKHKIKLWKKRLKSQETDHKKFLKKTVQIGLQKVCPER